MQTNPIFQRVDTDEKYEDEVILTLGSSFIWSFQGGFFYSIFFLKKNIFYL